MIIPSSFNRPIILGSQSPRRKELLTQLGYSFDVDVREVDESISEQLSAANTVEQIALKKANVFQIEDDRIVITADTIVAQNNQIFGKPSDRNAAISMLKQLSGNTHNVISAVVIKTKDSQIVFHEITVVEFKELSEQEITHYVDTYKPFDKAGSYGIQEWIGMIGITKIEGCYYNVMGLPTRRLQQELQKLA